MRPAHIRLSGTIRPAVEVALPSAIKRSTHRAYKLPHPSILYMCWGSEYRCLTALYSLYGGLPIMTSNPPFHCSKATAFSRSIPYCPARERSSSICAGFSQYIAPASFVSSRETNPTSALPAWILRSMLGRASISSTRSTCASSLIRRRSLQISTASCMISTPYRLFVMIDLSIR